LKTTLPKHTQKYIVQDNNGIGVKLVYLVGYCPDTLAYYNAFFKDAQKHFENLALAVIEDVNRATSELRNKIRPKPKGTLQFS
jgi:hypothetical protein